MSLFDSIDSGSPIVLDGTTIQVGINSFSDGDCSTQNYDVYTRVSYYQDWLEQQICDNSAVPPSSCFPSPTTRRPTPAPAPVPAPAPAPTTASTQPDKSPTQSPKEDPGDGSNTDGDEETNCLGDILKLAASIFGF